MSLIYGNYHDGEVWLRFSGWGWGLMLKSPKALPLFSERYGYKKPFLSFRGYRVFVLRPFDR